MTLKQGAARPSVNQNRRYSAWWAKAFSFKKSGT